MKGISPLPIDNWQATTGNPAQAAVGATPPDPQIALSSTNVVVGMTDRVFFYKKNGTPEGFGNAGQNSLTALNLFNPIITSANLGAEQNGSIDSFSDVRVIFDPYRKRFWVVATGAYRGKVIDPKTGLCKADAAGKCLKGAFTLPPNQRRSIIGVAVSDDEDPLGAWLLYWFDAAPGWGTSNPPYKPGDLADYPTVGINATTLDVSVAITDAAPGVSPTHSYPSIMLIDASAMANNNPGGPAGWRLYPLPGLSIFPGMCGPFGLLNPDSSCPSSTIQPTLAHKDPQASYFVSFQSEFTLVIWKVTNQLHPTVDSTEVLMSPFMRDPSDAPQKGSSAKIIMSNLGHWPLKSVWRGGKLFIVTNDADSSGRSLVRVLRLPTSDWPYVPSPLNVNSGGDQVLIGEGPGTTWYGWGAIEAAPNGDAVVVYTRTSSATFADIRYNVWPHDQKTMLGGRILKYGEAATAKSMRWGDLAGASVDFMKSKEGSAIWIVHEYARSTGSPTNATYGVWVGEIPTAK